MTQRSLLVPAILGLIGLMPIATAAVAAPSKAPSATGTAQARVLQPVTMANVAELRFGQIVQPTTAGTVTLSPTGAISSAGGAAGNEAIAQTGGGPAPGEFTITSAPGTFFNVFGPVSFTLSNGSSTMAVSLLTGALQTVTQTTSAVTYRLRVGGTLSLAGNQPVGTYTGSYTLQTVYQ